MNGAAYRVVSDLRARWRARLLLTAAVGLVCGVVVALAAGAYRTGTVPERYERAIGSNFDVAVIQYDGAPRTDEIRSLQEVTQAESFTFVFGGLASPESGEIIDGLVFAGSELAIGTRLVEGRIADPDVEAEFVATPSFLEATGAVLGDPFRLVTYTQEQGDNGEFGLAEPAGPSLTATLVGVVDGPQVIEDPTSIVVFSQRLLARPEIGVSQSNIVVGLQDEVDVAQFRVELDTLPGSNSFAVGPVEVIPPGMRRAISTQARSMWILAIVVAIAAVVAIGQVITRQLRLSAPERRSLAAIGFTDRQVLIELCARAAFPIVVGCLVGTASSVAFSGWFPMGYVRPLEPSPGRLVQAGALTIVVALLITALLAWVVASSYLSRSAVRSTRPSPTLDAITAGFASPAAGVGLRFALARATGERGSVRSTLAGSLVTLCGLVAAVTFGASVGRLIDEPFRYGANYDVAMGDNGGDAIDPRLAEALRNDPDVTSLMFYALGDARAGAITVPVSGLEPVRGDGTPVLLSGRLPIAADEIAFGRVTAGELGVGDGDTIELAGPTGTQSFRVTGLVVVAGLGRNEGVGEGGVVMLPGLARLDQDAAVVQALVRFRPGADGVAPYRDWLVDGTDAQYQPSVIVNISRVQTIPLVLAGVLAMLIVLTVTHGLFTSLRARRRDLAVLRSIGADRGFVSRVVHWQATAFAVAPAVPAVPLGFVAGRTIFRVYADGIGAVDDAVVPVLTVGVVGLGIVVLANLVAALPARRARRLTTAAVLQSE